MQRKLLAVDNTEVKFSGDTGRFSGYAATFGNVDSYGDTIMPGAFKETLRKRDRPVRMHWNHYGPVIGKWVNMEEDEKGLYVEGELTPGHSVASDVYASLKHGAVGGLSIGYQSLSDTVSAAGRTLKKIHLIEISPVESQADRFALVTDVKSAFESASTFKEIESLLRDVGGLSHLECKTLISTIKNLSRRDDEPGESEIKSIVELINKRGAPNGR